MKIFIFFYTIYGAAHFYAFLKIKSVFHISTLQGVFLGLFLLFMTFSPSIIHSYSLRNSETLPRVFAYFGYIWMALLVFFISTSVIFDLYNLIVRLSGFILQKDLNRIVISPILAFFIPVFLSIGFNIYGYFEAKDLQVERLAVETTKLPEGVNKLTIVQISDLHLGTFIRGKALNKVIKEIENVKPDIIVSTGDFLNAEVNHIDYLAGELKKVRTKLGKFAVTGNHEFYAGITNSLEFMQAAGFTILRGEGITVKNLINIAGVDDPTWESMNPSGTTPEKEILSKLPSDIFTLLLKHRPDIDKKSLGFFDLQLSGHTHKGQIFPINLATMFLYQPHAGYKDLPKGSAIYVSRGAGTAGPPVRFLSPPEVTIIEIVSIKETQKSNFKNQN